jgi:dipeptidyl-peptidase-4
MSVPGTSSHARETPLDAQYLRDHAETRGFMLGRPVQAKPAPDGKTVLFLRARARAPKLALYEFDVDTGKTKELLTPEAILKGTIEAISAEEKARRERQRVSVSGFTSFQISDDGSLALLSLSGKLYVYNRSTAEFIQLTTGPGAVLDPKFAPDGQSVGFVRDFDLYVVDMKTNKERRLTTGGAEKKTHGLAEFVAQEEMGRFTGYWWAPDSQSIVYEEADASQVEVWYVSDPAKPEQPAHLSSYPRPGKANASVRLGIVHVQGGPTTWIEWNQTKYPYLTQVRWDKDSPLTIQVEARDQKELALLLVNPTSRKTTVLLTETDSAWINLHQDVPRYADGGKSFLWISERDGGPQLELRSSNGSLKKVLVPPSAGLHALIDVNTDTGDFVFQASTDPTQAHLYRQTIGSDKPERLTRDAGLHSAAFSKNHAVYARQSILADAMPKTTVLRSSGETIGVLPSVAEDPGFVPKAEIVKIGDEPGYYASILRPYGFTAKKHYPVILHVYGGPKHQMVLASMPTRLLDQWLADQGFIVVALDGRGTPGRGRDWERSLSKHFGSVPLDDQVAGLKALGRRFPEMDLDRVGIFGWSFGGYLSALAALRRPGIFKAAVAGAPVVDWLDYDTHYTERYLGLPDKNPEAYKEGSLLTYANDLKTPLLLIHGTADDNVYFRHSLKLADALFRAGKDFEILPLAGLTHMVPDPIVMQRLHGRIAGHFKKHLGEAKEKVHDVK